MNPILRLYLRLTFTDVPTSGDKLDRNLAILEANVKVIGFNTAIICLLVLARVTGLRD